MALATSYSLKTGSFSAYFDAIHGAEVPDRFSAAFLTDLGFDQTNDRQFLGVLKDMQFINDDGKPTQRYIDFLDKSESSKIIAAGVRDAFSELFTINKKAQDMDLESLKGKLKVLYKGKKSDLTVERIAKTFLALCELGDFSSKGNVETPDPIVDTPPVDKGDDGKQPEQEKAVHDRELPNGLNVKGLQYHINIVLPESRDPAIYDAIFSSLRRHLG